MAGIAVVTDSTSSLSLPAASRFGVRVIPLQVVIDDESRPEGAVSAAEVAQALRAGRRVSTSRPAPEAFAAAYAELAAAGCHAIVSAHLSGKISGTVAAAQVAAAAADLPVRVVDTQVIAMASGFAVLTGARAAAAGADVDQVAAAIRGRAAASTTYFYVDDLAYLRRGGRIGAATAAIGTALAVKPLLTVADGVIRPQERVRTTSRALSRLQELTFAALARSAEAGTTADVAVHHLDDEPAARRLVEQLEPRVPAGGSVVLAELSAVLGVHAGPGTLGVVVSPHD